MSDLDEVKIGDWLALVSTSKASHPFLQQVITVTVGLVKTQNYTFRKDGRAFYNHYKSLTARPASPHEIEKWLSRQKKQQTKSQQPSDDGQPEIVLARLSGVCERTGVGATGCRSVEEDQGSAGEVMSL